MDRWQMLEIMGAALIAFALAWVHPALGIGVMGAYFFAAAVLAQIQRPRD